MPCHVFLWTHALHAAVLLYVGMVCERFNVSLPDSTTTPRNGRSATLANTPPSTLVRVSRECLPEYPCHESEALLPRPGAPRVLSSNLVSTCEPCRGAAMHDFIVEHVPSCRRLCALSGCVSPCWPDNGSLYCTPDHAELAATYRIHAQVTGIGTARSSFAATLCRERFGATFYIPFLRIASHHWRCTSEACPFRRNSG